MAYNKRMATKQRGRPRKVGGSSRITVNLTPRAKVVLDVLSTLRKKTAGGLIEESLDAYVQGLKPDEKKGVEMMVRLTLGGGQ